MPGLSGMDRRNFYTGWNNSLGSIWAARITICSKSKWPCA